MLNRALLLGSLLFGFAGARQKPPAPAPVIYCDNNCNPTIPAGILKPIPIRTNSKDKLVYKYVKEPNGGSYPFDGPQAFTYKSRDDFRGPDSFSIQAAKKPKGPFSEPLTIIVTVIPPSTDRTRTTASTPNAPEHVPAPAGKPVALPPPSEPQQVPFNTSQQITLQASGQGPFTFSVKQPKCGSLSPRELTGANQAVVTYTPTDKCVGPDSFFFKVSNTQESDEATVNLEVASPPGSAPVALPPPAEPQQVKFNTPLSITLQASGQGPLTFMITKKPACGELSPPRLLAAAQATVTYTPTDKCAGPDRFSFRVKNTVESNEALVSIDVAARPQSGLDLGGLLPWLLPASSILIGLGAIGWAILIHNQAKNLKSEAEQERRVAEERLDLLKTELSKFEGNTPSGAQGTSASSISSYATNQKELTSADYKNAPQAPHSISRSYETEFSLRRLAQEPAISKQPASKSPSSGTLRAPTPQQAPLPTPDFSSFPSAAEIPAYSSAPAASISSSPSRLEKTGNIVADFNRAQSMGESGYPWFLSSYSCIILSCANLSDRRGNPTAELRFEEASRGYFLGASQEGQRVLLPGVDKDLDISRTSLEGAFTYLGNPEDDLRLLKPGLLRASGADWVLDRDGEIGRG